MDREYALRDLESHQVVESAGGARGGGGGAGGSRGAAAAGAAGVTTLALIGLNPDDGSIELRYPDNEELITDPVVVKYLKSTQEYKDTIAGTREAQQQLWADKREASEQETRDLINIHQLAPIVGSADLPQGQLASLVPQVYSRAAFSRPYPSQAEIEEQLRVEAEKNVSGALGRQKKLDEFFQLNYEPFRQYYLQQWANERDAFEQRESAFEQQQNAAFMGEYQARRSMLEQKLSASSDAIEDAVESWLGELDLPVEMSAQIHHDAESAALYVDLDLPEIEDLPQMTVTTLKSGQVKDKPKTQKQLREEYAQCVFSLAVFLAANIFNLNATLASVVISGYSQRRDKVGDLQDDYLYSVRINRADLLGRMIEDPEKFILSCQNRMKLSAAYAFSAIEPFGAPGW